MRQAWLILQSKYLADRYGTKRLIDYINDGEDKAQRLNESVLSISTERY